MIKLDKETKEFITGNIVGIITGIVTLYIYYDFIENRAARIADSPPNTNSPTQFGNMNISTWSPLTPQQINQIRGY